MDAKPAYRRTARRLRAAAIEALSSADPAVVNPALFDAVFHDHEWEWVQAEAFRLATHPVWNIRAAATALGHLARMHRRLDLDTAMPLRLRILEEDSEAAESARNALSHIRHFMPEAASRIPAR